MRVGWRWTTTRVPALLADVEPHDLPADLARDVVVEERLEARADGDAPPSPGPGPARPGTPAVRHQPVEDVEAARADVPADRPEMRQERLRLEQVPLGVLHADRRVHAAGQAEVGHVPDDASSPRARGAPPPRRGTRSRAPRGRAPSSDTRAGPGAGCGGPVPHATSRTRRTAPRAYFRKHAARKSVSAFRLSSKAM